MRKLKHLIPLMRPHQWLKNIFVFAGLLFSQSWNNEPLSQAVVLAFAAFCAFSSAVYIINDIGDRAGDARHPRKRTRPLASGVVTPPRALILACALVALGTWFASGKPLLLALLLIYVLLNLLYSWRLKHVPVVDVFIIASGFMLRLLAGTLAVGIAPSHWMLLTGLFAALFLGFCKRKAESFHDTASQRAVMRAYPASLLDTFISFTMTATLLTYSLFAISPQAQAHHGERLIYTVPVVIFGLLRYAYQVHQGRGEDVSSDLLRDRWMVLSLLVWAVIFLSSRW